MLSQTFVVDEVAALREAGAAVITVSLQGPAGADVALGEHRARSWWVLRRVASLAAHRPRALAPLIGPPLTFGLRLKLLAASEEARRFGANNVHAHFAYRSADGAEVIGRALGTGHSVTLHARDIFVPSGDVRRRLERARTLITVCEYNRRWLAQRHGQAVADRTVVVPCGTRVEQCRTPSRQDDPGQPGDRPTIIAIGRLVPKKGIDVLIEACAALESPFRLVVVGDGPEAPRLRDCVAAFGLASSVQFTGSLSHGETVRLLDAADIFCMPFLVAPDGDRDSMPVVVKEAMSASLPVVSTAEVGVPEMVMHGVNGMLVPPNDPLALAAALDTLLCDPARRAAMGRRGRTIVEQRFDLRQQASRLVEVFSCRAA